MKNFNRVLNLFVILITVLTFTINAQTKSQAKGNIALNGYCPVAYHAMNEAVKGKTKYSSSYEGRTYYFAKENAKEMFEQSLQLLQ